MELAITNFQNSAKRISRRKITFRAYRQLVIVIVKQGLLYLNYGLRIGKY